MYKILDLIPVIYSEGIKESIRDREALSRNLYEATQGLIKLDIDFIEEGPVTIESVYDEVESARYIVKKVIEAERKGYHAVVIDCFFDPALDACREAVAIPVAGPHQASCHLAAQLSSKFSIINPMPEGESIVLSLARKYGYLDFLASIETMNLPVLELMKLENVEAIARSIEKAVKEKGAGAVILGCTGMSALYREVLKILSMKALHIPVLEPLRAAVSTAVSWLLANVSHSKTSYRYPRALRNLATKSF